MKTHPKIAVVVVAAGRGERAGLSDGPKQYRPLGDKTVLGQTLGVFLGHGHIDEVVTVIHQDDQVLYATNMVENARLLPPVIGGATRQASVFAGLQALEGRNIDVVLVHDAARPFVSDDLIDRMVGALAQNDAVLPAVAVADTLKRADEQGVVVQTVSRDGLYFAQTPQGFGYETILAAHQKAAKQERSDFTDDCALAEWAGHIVHLVEGDAANNKLTTQADILEAQARMTSQIPDIRVGHGYDTHQFVEGDTIRLCGVNLPFDKKLSGHSDADVGLHALTDALLGAIASGDIGSHFPPSDAKWKDANSDHFLAHAASLVRKAGGSITHCDVTLVCEAPKIGPHRDVMRKAIAGIIDIDVDRVSVKATTNERIGFVGREEGMVALATATVVMGG